MSQLKIIELEEENQKLKKEVYNLTSKLEIVKNWMEREVKSHTHRIAKQKTSKLTQSIKEDFFSENFEEVIASRINWYFWDLLLLNAPKWTIEAITSAEISFYNMMKNPTVDWFAVISAYHKVLDLFVENFVINNFRKFAKKKNCTILRVNDHLEKSLNLVVNSKYIISVWRLYWLLKLIKEDQKLYDYWKCFKDYLDKYNELKNILLSDDIFNKLTYLNKSEVLSSKRHSWSISKKDTIEARKILIWEFSDKNSLIYKILEGQSVIF